MKKILKLTAAAALPLSLLTGCSSVSAEDIIKKAQTVFAEAESYTTDLLTDIDLTVSADGKTLPIMLDLDVTLDYVTADGTGHMTEEGSYNIGGEKDTLSTEAYLIPNGSKYDMYASLDGEWYFTEIDKTEAPVQGTISFEELNKYLSDFKVSAETYQGKNCYALSAEVDMQSAMDSVMTADESLSAFFGSEGIDNLTAKVPVTYYFEKSSLEPVGMKIELESLIDEILGLADLGYEFDIGKCTEEVIFRNFNQVKEITVPAEVIAAVTSSSSGGSSSDDNGSSDTGEIDLSGYDLKDTLYDTTGLTTIVYNGKSYELPVQWSELEAAGLVLEDDSVTVEADDMEYAFVDDADGNYMSLGFYNGGSEAVSIRECIVYSVDSDYDYGVIVESGKGIGPATTKEEMLKLLGEPSYSFNYGLYESYYWDSDDLEIQTMIDTDTGLVCEFSVTYYKVIY